MGQAAGLLNIMLRSENIMRQVKAFGEANMKVRLLSAALAAGRLCCLRLRHRHRVVKIGILNDQSGVYADYGGKWSFEAGQRWRRRILAAGVLGQEDRG